MNFNNRAIVIGAAAIVVMAVAYFLAFRGADSPTPSDTPQPRTQQTQ
jgi:hypothetical protein